MNFKLRTLSAIGLILCSAPALAQTAETNAAAIAGSTGNVAESRYYAVTLTTAFEPIDVGKYSKEFPGQTVYLTEFNLFGRKVYFVRLGFYATFADAGAAKDRLTERYPGAWATAVAEEEHRDAVTPGKAAPARVPTEDTQKPVSAAQSRPLFALTLDSYPSSRIRLTRSLPEALDQYRLYTVASSRNGKSVYLLRLGFFGGKIEADEARRELAALYPRAAITPVTEGERTGSAMTALQKTATPPPPTPASPPQKSGATDSLAEPLMQQGRDALAAGDNATAIRVLDQLLNLPPNKFSQDAQEFIGLARERNGDTARAKTEYELYIKLYPEGEGADRVRQRLVNLTATKTAAQLKPVAKDKPGETSVYGSVSQYYYHGASQVDTTTITGTTLDKATLTSTDQSALVSSLDLTARMRSSDYDNRAVIRDTHTWNFLDNANNVNRLNSAYFELKNRKYDYSARLGRQPGNSGGVLGRFDGLSAGYRFAPKWRLNVVAGSPADLTISSDVKFQGMNLEMGTFAEHWSGSVYFISQQVDGITDRKAAGADLRYFDPHQSYYSLVDYDIAYHELNTAMLQANWQTESHTTYNLLIDHRNAPTLQTTNALIGEPVTSVSTLLQTMTGENLQQQARDRTPKSNLYMFGFTQAVNKTWQYGADVRMYNISGTPASGALPAGPGTGDVYIYTAQTIGTGLLTQRDISVLSYSYLDSMNYNGNSWSFTNRSIIGEKWTVDTSLRYYTQTDISANLTKRTTPTLRLGYRMKNAVTLEIEGGVEKSRTESPTSLDDSRRTFYSLGYRWDF